MDLSQDCLAVVDALVRACSQDASLLKPAEIQLKSWENQPGFYSILANIFLKHDMDVSVRWLAVLYFKNGVDRYWRRNAPNAISEDEKLLLKRQLVFGFNEPVNQIATQLSVLIGKIARLDCPRYWPELIPVLLEAVRVDDVLLQQRATLTLYHVIKSLASKRLPPDRKIFEDLTANIFTFVFTMWETNDNSFMSALQNRDNVLTAVFLDRSILSLKVLRKLVVSGFAELDKSPTALEFLRILFERLDRFLKIKYDLEATNQELFSKREKIITLMSKVLLDVQEFHSEGFIRFIRPSLQMAVVYNFTNQNRGLIYERFTVNALNLMRSILHCETYRPAKVIEETKSEATLMAHNIKMEFFTKDVLVELCHYFVLHYFLLTAEDLSCWDSDPESFMSEESGDSWKFSIRPCTENLYLTLLKEFRDVLSHVVLDLVREYEGPVDPNDLAAVLRKDAMYSAVGGASFDMYDLVNFDEWFVGNLILELQNKHPNYRIIKRRILWLIGCWVGVKLSTSLRPKLYEILIPFLDRSEDLVVRIEAALTLKISVDDFEFKPQQFLMHLEASFGQLFLLLKDVSECETKMTILHVMSFIIERMQADIRPHAGCLIRYLPMLWDASLEHNMLRCAIITTLTHLVQGLGALCVEMFDLLVPVIKVSTDVAQEPHVYLYEDGLELWLNTIQCSPYATPPLLELFSNMPPLLELGTESLKICLKIAEAYILVGTADFFQRYSSILSSSLASLLNDIKMDGAVMIYKVVELVLKVFPEDGATVFSSMFFGIFQTLVDSQTPNLSSMQFPAVTSMYLVLFSRIILHSPRFFWSFIDRLAKSLGRPNSDILEALLDCWFDKMELISQPERKKSCAMALISLLSSNFNLVKSRFAGIITNCVETLHDVCRADQETGQQIDCFVMTSSNPPPSDDYLETEHDKRRHQLSLQDPIYSVSLRDYLFTHLNFVETQIGHSEFTSLMESLDCEIYQQLQEFLR